MKILVILLPALLLLRCGRCGDIEEVPRYLISSLQPSYNAAVAQATIFTTYNESGFERALSDEDLQPLYE